MKKKHKKQKEIELSRDLDQSAKKIVDILSVASLIGGFAYGIYTATRKPAKQPATIDLKPEDYQEIKN